MTHRLHIVDLPLMFTNYSSSERLSGLYSRHVKT